MDSGKRQALFLVDCGQPELCANDSTQQRYRAICLVCTRILLFLSRFPDKEHLKNVQWSYKLFSTQATSSMAFRSESSCFKDVNSDSLEHFFNELRKHITSRSGEQREGVGVSQSPVQLLYNALAVAVQYLAWDAPEIISPVRTLTSLRHSTLKKTHKRTQHKKQPSQKQNFIFICGTSPENELELRTFCGTSGSGWGSVEGGVSSTLADYVQRKLLPPPLLGHLESKCISVHWVHFGSYQGCSRQPSLVLTLMSDLLLRARGTLIPSSTLYCPGNQVYSGVNQQPACAALSKDDTVAGMPMESDSPLQSYEAPYNFPAKSTAVISSKDQMTNSPNQLRPISVQDQNSLRVPYHLYDSQCSVDSPFTAPSFDSNTIESPISTTENLTCNSKRQENGGSRKTANGRVWSSLALPSYSCLNRYLQDCVSDKNPTEHLAGGKRDLHWLYTPAGKLLCLLELTSMYNIQQSATSHSLTKPPTSGPMTDYKRSTLSERKRDSIKYSLTDIQTKPTAYSDKRKVKKKLNFSKINSDERKSASEMGVAKSSAEGEPTVTDSHCGCSSSPRMMILGVVKQNDFNLPSLCPVSMSVCSSLYIPREVRHSGNHTHIPHNSQTTLENETEGDVPMDPCASQLGNPPTHSCPLVNARVSSEPELSSDKENVTSSNHNLSQADNHPFTPPHRLNVKRALGIHRRRSRSVPLSTDHRTSLDQAITQCLDRSVTVDIFRCTPPNSPMVNSSLKVQRSISMSPRYPVIRLRDVLSNKPLSCKEECSKIPNATDCLSVSGRYHSKQFQSLCLWLTYNSLFLVVSVSTHNGSSSLAILQPITSLVASLTPVQLRFKNELLSKLVKRPSFSATSHSKRSLISEEHLTCAHGEDGRRLICEAELLTNLPLLCKQPTQESEPSNGVSLDPVKHLSPFTNQIVLPWFTYYQTCGIQKMNFEPLYRLHSTAINSPTSDSALRKLDLVSKLRTLYNDQRADILQFSVANTCASADGDQSSLENNEIESVKIPSETSNDLPVISSLDELREWFLKSYHKQIESLQDLTMKIDLLQHWTAETLYQFSKCFADITTKNHTRSSPLSAPGVQNLLWEEINSSMLIEGATLGKKYEALFKGVKERENVSRADKEQENDTEDHLANIRLNEYLLQVFLRFAALKACPDTAVDVRVLSDQLILLLRKISLMANPGLLGKLMKRTVLPLYISSCKAVLLEVYEGLMLPLPPDLEPDPDREGENSGASQEDVQKGKNARVYQEGTEVVSSGDESSFFSLQEPRHPQVVTTRRISRHLSFQDVASHRQITVVSKKRKKQQVKKDAVRDKLEPIMKPVRKSPRLATYPNTETNKGQNGVCRNLFSRSQSVCEGIGSLKRRRTDGEPHEQETKKRKARGTSRHSTMASDVLVKETPVKKQVENYRKFKLQRLRSKSSITVSPNVIAVEESPRRSFYSKPKITRLPGRVASMFNTPPIKQTANKQVSPANLLLGKEPSPATLHSLLHGDILSPSAAIDVSKSHNDHLEISRLAHSLSKTVTTDPLMESLSESPELFGYELSSQSHQRCDVIGRTPSKHVTSLDVLSTPTTAGGGVTLDSSVKSSKKNKLIVNYKTARVLTYESVKTKVVGGSIENITESHETETGTLSNQPPSHPISPQNHTTILDIASLYLPSQPSVCADNQSNDEICTSPFSSEGFDQGPTYVGGACLLTDIDPAIENESASMMAFALCTPTKTDRQTFHDILNEHCNSSP